MISLFKPKKEAYLVRFVLYLNYIFVVALILSYLASFINPKTMWIFGLLGLSYPFILLANVCFVAIWIVMRKSYFLISVLAILIGFGFIGKYYQKNKITKSVDQESYSIFSFNVHNFSKNYSGVYNKKVQSEIFQFIENQDADIVCLQEFCYAGRNVYASHAQLKGRLRANNYLFESYFNPQKSKVFGMVSYSCFPIVGKGIFDMKDTRKFGIYTDLKIKEDTVRLYNIHLESIHLNYTDYSYVTGINVSDSAYQANTKQIFKKLIKAFGKRAEQVKILKDHMNKSPYPVIICGDFNDTPASYTYHQLTSNYQDAFECCGNGIGKTLKGKIPAFRIDYVIYDNNFTPLSYQELKVNLSDHYPVKSEFVIKPD